MATTAIAKRSLLDMFIPRAQANPPGPTDDFWYGPTPQMSAGQNVNGVTALTFSGCWSATNTIAGLFGALPFKPYKKTPDGREEASKHSLYKILSREPNPEMDSFVFWEMMTQWWINYGNAFAEIQRTTDTGKVYALWPIHPTRVKPEKDSAGIWTGRWIIRKNNGEPNYLDNEDVYNIVGHLSDDGLIGKGVLAYAAKAIGTGLAEQAYEAGFYASGGSPNGVLEHPKVLSAKARDELRREWKQVHGKGNEVAVLWEGMKFTPTSVDPEHAQLILSRVFSIQEMARFYDLPPHVLYELSKGTFANTEEMNRFLVSQSLFRRIVRVEKATDRQLFTEQEKNQDYYAKFNVKALLRGDPKQQAEVDQIRLKSGTTSQDEIRERNEENKLPDGKGSNFWIDRNLATIDLVLNSGGEIPGGASQTIPDTPPNPPTPPGAGKKNQDDEESDDAQDWIDRNRELRGTVRRLSGECRRTRNQFKSARNRSTIAKRRMRAAVKRVEAVGLKLEAAGEAVAALEASKFQLETSLASVSNEKTTITGKVGQLEQESATRGERIAAIEQDLLAVTAQRDDSAVIVDSCKAELAKAIEQQEVAKNRAGIAEAALKPLETRVLEAESAKTTLEAEVSRLEASLKRTGQAFDQANRRADDSKARVDSLSTEVGTLRAEAQTLRTQTESLTAERDRVSLLHAEVKEEIKSGQAALEKAKSDAAQDRTSAESRFIDARQAVAVSIRGLLDQSLDLLLTDEAQWVKEAARKPEQFKEIINGHYHHFSQRLTAQLTQASVAMEKLGSKRVDMAKVASDYVAESRTKLNNRFHNTPRADLRVEVRKEVESWEGRKQTLINWIGE